MEGTDSWWENIKAGKNNCELGEYCSWGGPEERLWKNVPRNEGGEKKC